MVAFGLDKYCIGWVDMKLSTDIHGSHTMAHKDFSTSTNIKIKTVFVQNHTLSYAN